MTVQAGETLALVGPCAAGKTAILRLLLGVDEPASGVVRVFGGRANDPYIRRRVGYVPARIAVDPRYTVRDLLDFYAVLHGGHDRVWVEALIERFSVDPGARIGRLNPFRRRIVGITVAVAHRPGLLIFDQPAEPAPPSLRASLHQLIAELTAAGAAVVTATRSLDHIDTAANRVAVVDAEPVDGVARARHTDAPSTASGWLSSA
ncbi:ATP-binding cassette domain-containing protein [Phytohabitans sp. LJ34]|uniref:ATP-binding cassette domain-containing protein n=1 Tax=Phytohabitans sp. LJ34 TaxID=3452217 RepID=UPI003F8A7F31